MDINGFVNLELKKLSSENIKIFNKKLTPTKYEMQGVRVPDIKKLAKLIAADYPEEFFPDYRPDTFEGVMAFGFVISYHKCGIEELLDLLDGFLPLVDNWAVCDSVCANMKIFKKHREKVLDHFLPLKNSPEEFDRRWLAIVLMDYFLDDEYIDRSLEIYATMPCGEYYVDMAIAWGLATAMVKHFDKTAGLMRNGGFSRFVQNKAIQKARESFRISAAQKELLLSLKIK